MLKKTTIIAAFLILTSAAKATAIPARTVYQNDANSNAIELKVWKGYGLTINLMSTGETIKQVWIGDPSRFAFTSNGALCQSSGNDSDCTGGKATVIFLRQIDPINFPVTSSSNGSTQITVLTNEKQYQFKIVPASGNPAYTSLVIKSDSERPLPITRPRTPQPLTVEKPQSAPPDFPQPSPPPQTITVQKLVNWRVSKFRSESITAYLYMLALPRIQRARLLVESGKRLSLKIQQPFTSQKRNEGF